MVEEATTSLFQLVGIKNHTNYLDVLLFASTEEYPAVRYLFQACRGTRHFLFKREQGTSLYLLYLKKFKQLLLPALYYNSLMPRKELCVLKAMLNEQRKSLGKLLYNAKIDG